MALTSAQRQQTLHKLTVVDMEITLSTVVFFIKDLLKHSRPNNVGLRMVCSAYPQERKLCVHTYLLEYLKRTKECRGKETGLFISFRKPFLKVTKGTIARWSKTVMQQAGVNVSYYKLHSTRSAAVSKVNAANFPIMEILSHAGWAKEKTFEEIYNKPIDTNHQGFSNALLGN